jgi:hypothetical protein
LRLSPIILIALLMAALLTACDSPSDAPPPDPLAIITTAAERVRAVETFRITVDQSGPDYFLYTDYAAVMFRSASAQYVAPDTMQATVRVIAAGLPITIDVYAKAEDQWYRALWTGNSWLNQPFQADFNPATLIAEEAGFQTALDSLIELTYGGATTLESGVEVYQLNATASGPDVTALLGGLIEPVGVVEVEVYVARADGFPVRFVVREFDSPFTVTPAPGQTTEPVTWTIDLFDIDAPAEIDEPVRDAAAESTPDVTPEASAEGTAETTADATPELSAEGTAESGA